jgi:hypothetical protein
MKKPQPSNKPAPNLKDGKSSFLEAFKKSPALAKGLKHLVDAKDENAKPNIVDGTYVARIVDVKFGAYNGVPNVVISFKVDKGPYRDVTVKRRYDFGKTKPDSPVNEEEIFARIGVDLERMGADRSSTDPANLMESFEELKESQPLIQINVRNNGNYLNVYVNRLIESGTVGEPVKKPAQAAEQPSEEGEEESSEEGEPSEETEASQDEDEGEVEVEVGDVVTYLPPGQKKPREFQVIASQPASKMCNLKDDKGVIITSVPWANVEFVLEQGE